MKQIEIKFDNNVFDGKWQWFYFFILDLNDWFGCPFLFTIGDNNIFQNFKFDVKNWDKKSTKYALVRILWEQMQEHTIFEVNMNTLEFKRYDI